MLAPCPMEKRPSNAWLSRGSLLVYFCSLIGTQNHYPLSDHCYVSRVMSDNQYIWSSQETLLVSGSHGFAHISAALPQLALKKSDPSCAPAPSDDQIRTFEITLGLCAIMWGEMRKGALSPQHMITFKLVNKYWGWGWVSDPNLWQKIRDGVKEVPNVQSREAVCCWQKCSVPRSWDASQQPRVQICWGIQ
jgi:hypothetical protein